MPNISISFPDVIVDGVSFGKAADTIANNPKLASDVQRALEAERAALEATHAAALKAATDATAAVQATLDARIDLQNQLIAAAQDAHAKGDMAAVGAVIVEATKDDVQRKKDALDAQIAALTAQKAALA